MSTRLNPPPEAQTAALEEDCADDPSLLAEVRSLLAHQIAIHHRAAMSWYP